MNQKQLARVAKYQKKNMTTLKVRFHNVNDLEVINKLNGVPNKTDYIRQLILADIHKN